MTAVPKIALHDLRLVLQDRSATLWMLVLPVVFAVFFGLVMGEGHDPSSVKARLSVVNHDTGPLSQRFIDSLKSEGLDLVEIDPAAAQTTPDKVRTLVIPADFTDKILAGTRVVIRLERDPDTGAEAALVAEARIIAAVNRLIGLLIEASTRSEPGALVTLEQLDSVSPAPDVVHIKSRFAGRSRVTPSGFSQSIPGNTVMFIMLIALTYGAASLAAERSAGQLRRLVTTPASRSEIVLGKLAGRLVIAVVQLSVLVLVGLAGKALFGVSLGDDVFALWIVLLAYALCVAPLGVLVGALVQDPDRAASIGVIVTIVMAALGGCWWPTEVLSPTLQKVALLVPTGWAMKALHGVISFGEGLSGVAPSLAALVAFAAALTIIASRSLRIE
jgi:ABC-2 type transport system permease protein